eukprot:1380600-Amphidinium_carterae.1
MSACEGGEYDFIVVGAGSAGSVAASRLAAAPGPGGRGYRILLLEEGLGLRTHQTPPVRGPERLGGWSIVQNGQNGG